MEDYLKHGTRIIKELSPAIAQYSEGRMSTSVFQSSNRDQTLLQNCEMLKHTKNLLPTELLDIETPFPASNLKKSFP